MTQTYQIHGAGCNNCLQRIRKAINNLPEVKQIISIDLDSIAIRFHDQLEYIDINDLNRDFGGRYWLTVLPHVINFELVEAAAFVTKSSQTN